MITTYTYNPLIGISTVTDPKGDTQTYHYDEFNRLQFVKDSEDNILSENAYHYRTPN
jgi:YD repeat-containing protein